MTVVKAPTVKTPPSAPPVVFIPSTAPPGSNGGGIPVMPGQFIPPNGLAGFMQQTPAVQALYRKGRGGGGRRRRKKAAGAVKRRVKSAAKRRVKRAAKKKFTKGSAAAKRHMAKLRKMRKR